MSRVHAPPQADKIQDFFAALGLEEKETLNGVAKAGSCQFSCLADQLYGRECTKDWRPDILLRKLALYVIATNEVRRERGKGLWVGLQGYMYALHCAFHCCVRLHMPMAVFPH